jgi:hypothetical protein
MNKGFQLDVKWHDNDLLEVRITAWNGAFGGAADVYLPIGGLRETAEKLSGFPRNPTDKREVLFGRFGPVQAGGAVGMRFYGADGAGHTYVESKIESDNQIAGVNESVVLSILIEPAALDSFVEDLRRLDAEKTGAACLCAV